MTVSNMQCGPLIGDLQKQPQSMIPKPHAVTICLHEAPLSLLFLLTHYMGHSINLDSSFTWVEFTHVPPPPIVTSHTKP